MKIFKKISEIKSHIQKLKSEKKIISFVPTMGFLHEGHLSLIDEAKKNSDIVVVSIFVNKKQFNDVNDFKNYPKNLETDIKKLESKKTGILFCPDDEEIYQNNNEKIDFDFNPLANNLCGKYRENHFEGVALIVKKLFDIVKPNIAIFGQKDFQQLQIIKKLVRDFNLNIKIISAPIVREATGLAMSSRNSRLSKEESKKAAEIYRILQLIKKEILEDKNLELVLKKYKKELLKYFDKIDYLEICDEENLQIIKQFNKKINSRIFIAVFLGKVRLIDNIKII